MSKPRYAWWGYVKNMIRRYPSLKAEYEELHSQSVTAQYSSLPHTEGVSRGTEMVSIRELPSTRQREYEAVRRAIEQTRGYANSKERLAVVDMVLWKRSHTVEGAALNVSCSYATARRYHWEFIITVAKQYGLLDKNEPLEPKKYDKTVV